MINRPPEHAPPITGLTRAQQERFDGRRSRVLWLTGLSGAGKSTLAYAAQVHLHELGRRCVVLDGDNLRHGLCADLDFTPQGRRENLRRAAEVAKLFVESGMLCIAAFISPTRQDRDMVKGIIGPADFSEIYLDCSLQVCESRDTKGLYKRARRGEIGHFTGISAPYEPPPQPSLILPTGNQPIESCLELLIEHMG